VVEGIRVIYTSLHLLCFIFKVFSICFFFRNFERVKQYYIYLTSKFMLVLGIKGSILLTENDSTIYIYISKCIFVWIIVELCI